jgi:HlyD family secretion protein
VIAARTEVSLAQLLFDRTRIRAPIDGTVLQVMGKVGETVSPSPEQPVVVIGDTSAVVVKAEVDERDISKIKVGQRAFVRSAAFPNRDFEGKVSRLAPALGPPQMNARGPRRPTDVEVLEVTIEFENAGPLMPGLRVDTFFRRES